MPQVIDKRRGEWCVTINNRNCPHLIYPRSDIACDLLEKGKLDEDSYCCFENCPRKEW